MNVGGKLENLADCIERAQRGDRDAFGAIVEQFQNMAVGYARSQVGSLELAEEIAQEAFTQAYLSLGKLRIPQAFPSWFRRIVYKYCDRQFRGKKILTVPYDEGEVPDLGTADQEQQKEKKSLHEMVIGRIKDLPQKERLVATLYYIDGYSQKDVGAFLDIPVTTVKNRLFQARKKIRERPDMSADGHGL